MKLNPHQKEIVKKIELGEVFDIYSYLHAFQKGHLAKHDLTAIMTAFRNDENGKVYRVLKHDAKTDIYIKYTTETANSNTATYNAYFDSYKPTNEQCDNVEAFLEDDIQEQHASIGKLNYRFDFLHQGAYIANDFMDIKDFLTLWSYLKREALIFESDVPVESKDIGVFFESRVINRYEGVPTNITSQQFSEHDSVMHDGSIPLDEAMEIQKKKYYDKHGYYYEVPKRKMKSYINHEWVFNYANYALCKEYIGVRFAANSALRIYISNGCRTDTEINQKLQLFVAWCAIGISVFFGIVTLMQSLDSNTAVLNQINSQVVVISQDISEMKSLINRTDTKPMINSDPLVSNHILKRTKDIVTHISEELILLMSSYYPFILGR